LARAEQFSLPAEGSNDSAASNQALLVEGLTWRFVSLSDRRLDMMKFASDKISREADVRKPF
jgi:hypothetical protein